jgi:integrase
MIFAPADRRWRRCSGSASGSGGERAESAARAARRAALTLIAANLNPKVIQARLGHATITETMDTYGHLFPDAEDLGRGAIDAILAVALTEQERNQET